MDNEEKRYRKIGTEKSVDFRKDFDKLYDKYLEIAEEQGYKGDIKFVKEKERVLVYIVIWHREKL